MNFNIPQLNINIPKVPFKGNDNKTFTPNYKTNPIPNDSFELSIGYVNDIHGQTNNMMRILSGLKGDLKLSAGDNDIGDEKNKAVHKATAKFLNMADIKASALGNHEMDTTQADLVDTFNETNTKFLATNVEKVDDWEVREDNIEKYGRCDIEKSLESSTIVEVKGEKIGLIGASPMDMLERLTHPNYHQDCVIDDLDETIEDIQEEIEDLKEQGVNKVILLSHLGHKRDKIVAQKTDGIDVIIGGHTHELIKDIKENENLFYSKSGEPVILTEAGRDGNYFGNLNLTFDKDGVITKAQNNVAETRLFAKNMINQYIFNDILGKPERIGYVKEAPAPPESLIEENPHANFVCDVMREKTNSDIGIWHHCGIRSFFHEGVIDSSDIKAMSPFLDYVAVANVSEKNLVDLFKHAIETTYKSPGQKPGLIAVSGLNYTVDSKEGKLVAMNYIDKNGQVQKIDIDNPREDKTYKLVTDEFLMSAGADFDVLCPEEECLEKFDYDKDHLVCEYIKEQGKPVIINQTGRISFINQTQQN